MIDPSWKEYIARARSARVEGEFAVAKELYKEGLIVMAKQFDSLSWQETEQLKVAFDKYKIEARALKAEIDAQEVARKAPRVPVISSRGGRGDDMDGSEQDRKAYTYMSSVIQEIKPKTNLEDVIGLTNVKAELEDKILAPLIDPDAFKPGAGNIPEAFSDEEILQGSIIMFGPSGTGKTYIAKSIAGEAKKYGVEVSFLHLKSGGAIYGEYVGTTEARTRAMFKIAREKKPAVLFIDEGDALIGSRAKSRGENRKAFVAQYIAELGSEENMQVVVMTATNSVDIDMAILDRSNLFYVPLPAKDGRYALFERYSKGLPIELKSQEISLLSELSVGLSGRAIAKNICLALGVSAAAGSSFNREDVTFETLLDKVEGTASKSIPITAVWLESAKKKSVTLSAAFNEDYNIFNKFPNFWMDAGDKWAEIGRPELALATYYEKAFSIDKRNAEVKLRAAQIITQVPAEKQAAYRAQFGIKED